MYHYSIASHHPTRITKSDPRTYLDATCAQVTILILSTETVYLYRSQAANTKLQDKTKKNKKHISGNATGWFALLDEYIMQKTHLPLAGVVCYRNIVIVIYLGLIHKRTWCSRKQKRPKYYTMYSILTVNYLSAKNKGCMFNGREACIHTIMNLHVLALLHTF